jgi:EAL domain-containing protein (putative c-di-GMP-specific phosphodiesterase class I)
MKLRAVDRLSLEARLRRAVTGQQLVVHYQPQVKLATGKISGLEALVRWNDPDRGLVEAEEFIPVAEESRLIVPIGEWVLRKACQDMKSWESRPDAPPRVCVNLSLRQFQQHDLVETVAEILRETGLAGAALELEVTEMAAMHNPPAALHTMRELRALGVSLAIDDFGSGFSSLSNLRNLPVSALKIDRHFVNDLPADEHDAAVVAAVAGIGRAMKLRVVAEGVETIEQFGFLRSHDCDEAQGYYFSAALPADEVVNLFTPTPLLSRQPRLTL